MTAPDLLHLVAQIDKALGDGYAKAHPQLLAAYVVADAIEELTESVNSVDLAVAADTIASAILDAAG